MVAGQTGKNYIVGKHFSVEEQTIFTETLTRKLYSQKAVMIGTLLGGPLAGGYLLAKNYKALNQPEKIGRTWIFSIIAFALLMVLAFIVPEQVPGFVYFFLYAWMGHFAAQKLQGSFLQKHASEGGVFYSNWKAAGIGIIVALVFVLIVLAAFLLMDIPLTK